MNRNLIHCVLQLRETIGHVAVIEEHGPKRGAMEIATTTASDMDKSGRKEISKSKGRKELTEYKNWFFICCYSSSSFLQLEKKQHERTKTLLTGIR